ncbi:MAG: hypothetical protein KKD07_04240 [Candidatus Omnitrophica bacterium]|nr:hypothetical protein [Candidatus Omnitrophota bacterium]MBU1996887.1 hypothetical protein [Candidatus Omnitrophota bacterium]MBU4333634.1 hypothetical protein [Candidatus Omnitrophota bacterium]
MKRSKALAGMFLFFAFVLMFSGSVFADGAQEFKNAFADGKFSGEIGSYFEYKANEASDTNTGWANAYLTFKYETLAWNNLQFGTRFFAHGQLYNEAQNSSDPFGADVESEFTLPELYLNYGFGDSSNVRAGRFDHKMVSHIDDAQSEGAYVQFKELENIELIAGFIKRFAEIDYDDGEDFGRTNDAQDLNSESTFGSGSSDTLIFLEGKYKPVENLTLNPFFMYHDDYANVVGLETSFNSQWDKYEIEYGGSVLYEYINAEIAGSDDANVFAIMPFVKKGPVKLDFCYSKFSDGSALNKPQWLADINNLVDQENADGLAGSEFFETRIKYSFEKLWLSYAFGIANYDTSSSVGNGFNDNEFQVGYKVTDSFDVNVRYFIVSYDDIANKDYNKVETLIKFKF